jgi:hypothetical protein
MISAMKRVLSIATTAGAAGVKVLTWQGCGH